MKGRTRMLSRLEGLWQNRALMGEKRKTAQILDFMSAALEIKESLPHPASRITAALITSLFTIGIIWASVSEVDIVATAEGKIVPSGHVKQIQPLEGGFVSRILVKEGQGVVEGEPLIELDRTRTTADQSRLEMELLQNRLNYARLDGFISSLAGMQLHKNIDWPDQATPSEIKHHVLMLEQQLESYSADQARLTQQLANKKAERQVNDALINKLDRTLPLVSQRVDALKKLSDKQMAARVQYLELEQERIELQEDLVGAKARNIQLNAQLVELQHQQSLLRATSHRDSLQQLLELKRQQVTLDEELVKARHLDQKQILQAPVNGIVQELAIHTIGGVVTPAQTLMKIVPANETLHVEAWLENKDIGFVEPGQTAEIKVHTFPFTKYGVLDAEVTTISSDAVADERRGLIYKVLLKLNTRSLMVGGNEVSMVPGMGVSAELKTGKRYLAEYLIAPISRYKNESLVER